MEQVPSDQPDDAPRWAISTMILACLVSGASLLYFDGYDPHKLYDHGPAAYALILAGVVPFRRLRHRDSAEP